MLTSKRPHAAGERTTSRLTNNRAGPTLALKLLSAALCLLPLPYGMAAEGDARYVSDRLRVPLRSGPTNQHRILGFLTSGTAMTLLQAGPEGDYVNVRTSRGTEGWIEQQHLSAEPVARDQLAAAGREVEQARRALNEARQRIRDLESDGNSARGEVSDLEGRLRTVQAELDNVRTISADALEQYSANQRLTELNERLRDELDDLIESHQRLEANLQQRWLLLGAGLVLGGLLLGVLIKARPRRSGWS